MNELILKFSCISAFLWHVVVLHILFIYYLLIIIVLIEGGEDNTIKFMESKSLISNSTPLIEESYAYGIVEHPFPLNCLLREWYLGPDFYQAVKIRIVQYVWPFLFDLVSIQFYCDFILTQSHENVYPYPISWKCLLPDDTETHLCPASNAFSVSWSLWWREVWMGICVRCSFFHHFFFFRRFV